MSFLSALSGSPSSRKGWHRDKAAGASAFIAESRKFRLYRGFSSYRMGHVMNLIINLLASLGIIGCYLGIVKLISFILNLFLQKFRFFALSIVISWIAEAVLSWASEDIEIPNDIFLYIISPCLFLCILYLCGKIQKTSFSIFEYIFSFIVYIPSQFIIFFIYIIIRSSLGYHL